MKRICGYGMPAMFVKNRLALCRISSVSINMFTFDANSTVSLQICLVYNITVTIVINTLIHIYNKSLQLAQNQYWVRI